MARTNTDTQSEYIERAHAADEQLMILEARFDELEGEHKEKKAALSEAHDAMFDARRGGESQQNLGGLIDDFARREDVFDVVDRDKRSAADQCRKLRTRVLGLFRSARQTDPELFDSGSGVLVADLIGDDAFLKDLTTEGYKSVQDYVKGRDRLIAGLVTNGTLPRDMIDRVDRAVYRYLETRGIADQWPLDKPPAGEQLVIGGGTGDEDEQDDPLTTLEGFVNGETKGEPAWAGLNLSMLISGDDAISKAGEDVIEAIVDHEDSEDEDGAWSVDLLMYHLGKAIHGWKPKGREKLRVNGKVLPDQILGVFAEMERRHVEEPSAMYEHLVGMVAAISQPVRDRVRVVARALYERAQAIAEASS